jgi:hypothetical protein
VIGQDQPGRELYTYASDGRQLTYCSTTHHERYNKWKSY